jgi:hypothetical protein
MSHKCLSKMPCLVSLIRSLTVPETFPTSSVSLGFPTSETSTSTTKQASTLSAASSSSSGSATAVPLQSQSPSKTSSIVAGVIGTIVALIVVGVLAWVILMSRHFRSRGAQLEPEEAGKSIVNSSPEMRTVPYSTTTPMSSPRL